MFSNYCSNYCCLSEYSYHSHLYRSSFSPSSKGYLKCHHLQEDFLESDSMSQLSMRVSCFVLYLLLYCSLSVIFNIFVFFISLRSVPYSSPTTLPASAGDIRDLDSIPGSGRSPGEGNGYPLQYSCLEDPTDSLASTVHGVTESNMTDAA